MGPPAKSEQRREDDIRMDLKEIGVKGEDGLTGLRILFAQRTNCSRDVG